MKFNRTLRGHEMEYSKPVISDYGDLQQLTAALVTGGHTDVPSGTVVDPTSPHIFS